MELFGQLLCGIVHVHRLVGNDSSLVALHGQLLLAEAYLVRVLLLKSGLLTEGHPGHEIGRLVHPKRVIVVVLHYHRRVVARNQLAWLLHSTAEVAGALQR